MTVAQLSPQGETPHSTGITEVASGESLNWRKPGYSSSCSEPPAPTTCGAYTCCRNALEGTVENRGSLRHRGENPEGGSVQMVG